MNVKYIAALATASILGLGLAVALPQWTNAGTESTVSQANPCAGNPCAADPCAGNPCAANPCAADPCAGVNPCAGNPCAADPCAGVNPCAGNPCAADPCAGVNPCAGANPCAGEDASSADSAPMIYSDTSGLAIRGTDPVAYFTEGSAVQGSEAFEHVWMGATWRFSSAEHRDLFVNNPEAYTPEYGGYCAKAVSEGNLASIDPNAWRLVDGKLYLNYSIGVQNQWLQDVPGNIAKGDANWPGVLVGNVVHH